MNLHISSNAKECSMSRRVIWQQCYDHTWSIHIPWPVNKDISWTLHACLALIEDIGSFVLEASVNGLTKDINLANVCVPIPVGPISVEICIANLTLSGGNVAFDLVVKACIDVSVGPIHLSQCVILVSQHIAVHLLATGDHRAFGILESPGVSVYAYFSSPLDGKQIEFALSQPQSKRLL
jgi:hypothetical protein